MAAMSTRETVGRIFGSAAMILTPCIIYFLVALPGLLPWTFLLPWALYKRFRMLEPNRLRIFLEVWFVFVFAFFSLCAIKKAAIYRHAFLRFCRMAGHGLHRSLRDSSGKRDTGLIVSLFAFLAVVIVGH